MINCNTVSIAWLWWLILCVTWLSHGSPDIWSDISLGVFVRVCLDEVNIWMSRLSNSDSSPLYGWALSSQLKARTERLPLPAGRTNCSCPMLVRCCFVLSCFLPLDLNWNISSSWVSSPPMYRRELQHHLSWFPALRTGTVTKLADFRSWDLSASTPILILIYWY